MNTSQDEPIMKTNVLGISGNRASNAKQHSKKYNGGFHAVKEAFGFFAAMRAG